MANNIDERIVQMTFNNKEFEKGAKETIKTLGNLEDALKFKNATDGLEKTRSYISDTFVPSIDERLKNLEDTFERRFSIMGTIANRFAEKIADTLYNSTVKFAKFLTIGDLMPGFDKYATRTKAVQTITNATGKSVEEVEKVLQKLMKYTDETSYDFSTMVSTIGKFTSVGVDLEMAEKAMEGIANEAAKSGASVTEANRAMYNFAQALSSGVVRLIDWKSIENANMATKEFKEQLISTAIELGTLEKKAKNAGYVVSTNQKTLESGQEALKKATKLTKNRAEAIAKAQKKIAEATKKVEVNYQTFNSTLSDKWLTTDVLVKTLEKYSDTSTEFGLNAYYAAQKALTFKDAIDATHDAISSSWMQTSQYIFGNLNEAMDLWTRVANALYDGTALFSEWRNGILEAWHEFGGYTAAIEAASNIWHAFYDTIVLVKDAIFSVSPLFDATDLINWTKKLRDATQSIRDALEPRDESDDYAVILREYTTETKKSSDETKKSTKQIDKRTKSIKKHIKQLTISNKLTKSLNKIPNKKNKENNANYFDKIDPGIDDKLLERAAENGASAVTQARNRIYQLQRALQSTGYLAAESFANGIYGPETQLAVAELQNDIGVEITGLWDDVTAKAAQANEQFSTYIGYYKQVSKYNEQLAPRIKTIIQGLASIAAMARKVWYSVKNFGKGVLSLFKPLIDPLTRFASFVGIMFTNLNQAISKNKVDGFIDGLLAKLGPLGTLIKVTGDLLNDFLDGYLYFVSTLPGALKKSSKTGKTYINGAKITFASFFDYLGRLLMKNPVIRVINGAANVIIFIVNTVSKVVAIALTGILAALKLISPAIKPIVQTIVTAGALVVATVISVFGKIVSTIKRAFGILKNGGSLSDIFKDLLPEDTYKDLQKRWKSIRTWLKNIPSNVSTFFVDLKTAIVDNGIVGGIEYVKTKIKSLLNYDDEKTFGDNFLEWIGNFKKSFIEKFNSIKTAFLNTNFVKTFKEASPKLYEAIKSGFTSVVNLLSSVGDAIVSAYNFISTAVGNLLDSIFPQKDPLTESLDEVYGNNGINGILNSIISNIKTFLNWDDSMTAGQNVGAMINNLLTSITTVFDNFKKELSEGDGLGAAISGLFEDFDFGSLIIPLGIAAGGLLVTGIIKGIGKIKSALGKKSLMGLIAGPILGNIPAIAGTVAGAFSGGLEGAVYGGGTFLPSALLSTLPSLAILLGIHLEDITQFFTDAKEAIAKNGFWKTISGELFPKALKRFKKLWTEFTEFLYGKEDENGNKTIGLFDSIQFYIDKFLKWLNGEDGIITKAKKKWDKFVGGINFDFNLGKGFENGKNPLITLGSNIVKGVPAVIGIVTKGIGQLISMVKPFIEPLSTFAGILSTMFTNLYQSLNTEDARKFFDGMKQNAINASNSVKGFFSAFLDPFTKVDEDGNIVVDKIKITFQNFYKHIVDTINKSAKAVGDAAVTAASPIVNFFNGETWNGIVNTILIVGKWVLQNVDTLINLINSLMILKVGKAAKNLSKAFTNFSKAIYVKAGGKVDTFADVITKLAKSFAIIVGALYVLGVVTTRFNVGSIIGTIVGSILTIAGGMWVIFGSYWGIIKLAKKANIGQDDTLKKIGETLKDIGFGMLGIVGSIGLLAGIFVLFDKVLGDPIFDKEGKEIGRSSGLNYIKQAIGAIALFVAGILILEAGLNLLITKLGGSTNFDVAIKIITDIGIGMLGISVSMGILAASMKYMDPKNVWDAWKMMLALIGVLGLMVAAVSWATAFMGRNAQANNGKLEVKMESTMHGIVSMALAMFIMSIALGQAARYFKKYGENAKSAAWFLGIMTLLFGIITGVIAGFMKNFQNVINKSDETNNGNRTIKKDVKKVSKTLWAIPVVILTLSGGIAAVSLAVAELAKACQGLDMGSVIAIMGGMTLITAGIVSLIWHMMNIVGKINGKVDAKEEQKKWNEVGRISALLLVISAAIGNVAYAMGQGIKLIKGVNWQEIVAFGAAITASVLAMAKLVKTIKTLKVTDEAEKSAARTDAMILVISVAIGNIAFAIGSMVPYLKEVNWREITAFGGSIAASIAAMALPILALAKVFNNTGVNALVTGGQITAFASVIIAIGVAIGVTAGAMKLALDAMQGVKWESIAALGGAMAASVTMMFMPILALARVFHNTGANTLKTGGQITALASVIMSIGLALGLAAAGMSFAIKEMSWVKYDELLSLGGAMAIAIGAMIAPIIAYGTTIKNVTTGGQITAFAGVITAIGLALGLAAAGMSFAIKEMEGIDGGSIVAFGGAMAIALVGIAVPLVALTKTLGGLDLGHIAALIIGIVVVAAAVGAVAFAFAQAMIPIKDILKEVDGGTLVAFGGMLAIAIIAIAGAIAAFGAMEKAGLLGAGLIGIVVLGVMIGLLITIFSQGLNGIGASMASFAFYLGDFCGYMGAIEPGPMIDKLRSVITDVIPLITTLMTSWDPNWLTIASYYLQTSAMLKLSSDELSKISSPNSESIDSLAGTISSFVSEIRSLGDTSDVVSTLNSIAGALTVYGYAATGYAKDAEGNTVEIEPIDPETIRKAFESIKDAIPIDVISEIGSFAENGENNLDPMVTGIGAIGAAIGAYATAISDIKNAPIDEAKSVIDMVAGLYPNLTDDDNFINTAKFLQENHNEISKVGGDLEILGGAMKTFGESIKGLSDSDVKHADACLSMLTAVSNMLPNEGGVIAWFTGDNSLGNFGENIKKLGTDLAGYADTVKGHDFAGAKDATGILHKIVTQFVRLDKTGGIKSWWTGSQSWSNLGNGLAELGTSIITFQSNLNGFDSDFITSALDAVAQIASIYDGINLDALKFVKSGKGALETIGIDLSKMIKQITTNMIDGVESALDGEGDFVEKLARLGNKVFEKMIGDEETFVDNFSIIGKRIFDKIKLGMTPPINDDTITTEIGSFFETTINDIETNKYGALYDTGKKFISAISDGMEDKEAVETFKSKFETLGKEIFKKIKAAIVPKEGEEDSVSTELAVYFKTVIGGIKTEEYDDLYDTGKSFVDAITDGMNDEATIDRFTATASGLAVKISEAFAANSIEIAPSKEKKSKKEVKEKVDTEPKEDTVLDKLTSNLPGMAMQYYLKNAAKLDVKSAGINDLVPLLQQDLTGYLNGEDNALTEVIDGFISSSLSESEQETYNKYKGKYAAKVAEILGEISSEGIEDMIPEEYRGLLNLIPKGKVDKKTEDAAKKEVSDVTKEVTKEAGKSVSDTIVFVKEDGYQTFYDAGKYFAFAIADGMEDQESVDRMMTAAKVLADGVNKAFKEQNISIGPVNNADTDSQGLLSSIDLSGVDTSVVKRAGKSFLTNLATGQGSISDRVVNAVTKTYMSETIASSAKKEATKEGTSIGTNLTKGVEEGVEKAAKPLPARFAKAAVKRPVEAANKEAEINSPSKLTMRLGKYLMQGILVGIKSERKDVKDIFVGSLISAYNAAKKALGIHSPSKATKYLGEMTIKGYTDAVIKGKPEVKSVGEEIAETITDALNIDDSRFKSPIDTITEGLSDSLKDGAKNIESDSENLKDTLDDVKTYISSPNVVGGIYYYRTGHKKSNNTSGLNFNPYRNPTINPNKTKSKSAAKSAVLDSSGLGSLDSSDISDELSPTISTGLDESVEKGLNNSKLKKGNDIWSPLNESFAIEFDPTQVNSAFTELGTSFTDVFKNLFKTVDENGNEVGIFDGLINQVKDQFGGLFSFDGEGGIGKLIKDFLGIDSEGGIVKLVTDFLGIDTESGLLGIISGGITSIFGSLFNLDDPNGPFASLGNLLESIVKKIFGLEGTAGDVIGGAAKGVGDAVDDAIGEGGLFGSIKKMIKDLISNLFGDNGAVDTDSIETGLNTQLNNVDTDAATQNLKDNMAQSVQDAVTNIGVDPETATSNLTKPLEDSLKTAADQVDVDKVYDDLVEKSNKKLSNEISVSPNLRPVVDISSITDNPKKFQTAIGINGMTTSIDATTSATLANGISLSDLNDKFDKYAAKMDAYIESMSQSATNIETKFTTLQDHIDNLEIYLDSGELVGGIGPKMNRYLGKQKIATSK